MVERALQNRRILVVEDEYMLADELTRELDDAGALVVGPYPAVKHALDALEGAEPLDFAILDINLGGERIDPVADVLTDLGVPFVFVTGYDHPILPKRFADIVRCEKPVSIATVMRAIERAIGA